MPATLIFAAQAVATTSGAESLTIQNTGAIALTLGTPTVSSSDFVLRQPVPGNLAPGASCAIAIVFAPTATGQRSGTVTIAANVQGGILTANVQGAGTQAGTMVLTPLRLDFGSVRIGQTSPVQYVTVANTGNRCRRTEATEHQRPVRHHREYLRLVAGGEYELHGGGGLLAEASGAASGSLVATDDAGTQTALLSGNGQTGPTDALSASALTFAAQAIGTTSAAQQVTVSNSGDSALTNIKVQVTGDFAVTNLCGIALPGHSACALAGGVFAQSGGSGARPDDDPGCAGRTYLLREGRFEDLIAYVQHQVGVRATAELRELRWHEGELVVEFDCRLVGADGIPWRRRRDSTGTYLRLPHFTEPVPQSLVDCAHRRPAAPACSCAAARTARNGRCPRTRAAPHAATMAANGRSCTLRQSSTRNAWPRDNRCHRGVGRLRRCGGHGLGQAGAARLHPHRRATRGCRPAVLDTFAVVPYWTTPYQNLSLNVGASPKTLASHAAPGVGDIRVQNSQRERELLVRVPLVAAAGSASAAQVRLDRLDRTDSRLLDASAHPLPDEVELSAGFPGCAGSGRCPCNQVSRPGGHRREPGRCSRSHAPG